MDASFRAAAAQYRQAAPKLTHAQRVCRLYRNALKTQNSWAVDRQVFIAEADKMRAEFDKHASLAATSVEARNLLERGEEKLFQESHPDRYIVAYLPGGSLYMRNAPLPEAKAEKFAFPRRLPLAPVKNSDCWLAVSCWVSIRRSVACDTTKAPKQITRHISSYISGVTSKKASGLLLPAL